MPDTVGLMFEESFDFRRIFTFNSTQMNNGSRRIKFIAIVKCEKPSSSLQKKIFTVRF